jgi:hypothetical protein
MKHNTIKSETLKLFVWTNFSPDWKEGLAFAIAKDETEAREMVVKNIGYDPEKWGDVTVHPLTQEVAYCVTGGS